MVLAVIMEPLKGHPDETDEFLAKLNAPIEGTFQSKRKAQQDIASMFGMDLDELVRKAEEREARQLAALAEAEAEAAGTPDGDDTPAL